jgi:hypothetical protein
MAYKCPLFKVGDAVTHFKLSTTPPITNVEDTFIAIGVSGKTELPGKTHTAKVKEIRYNDDCRGACRAFDDLGLLILDNGDVVNPGDTNKTDCSKCPVLI